jgi:hypothetical protein
MSRGDDVALNTAGRPGERTPTIRSAVVFVRLDDSSIMRALVRADRASVETTRRAGRGLDIK